MSTINIQPVVNANGETILAAYTPMGRYTCVLGPDFFMKMNEAHVQGSKALGFGSLRMNVQSGYDSLQNLNNTNNVHIYIYNSGGSEAVLFNGKLPNFVTGEPRGCQPAESNAEQRAKQRKQQAVTTAHRAQSKQRNDDPGKRLKQYKRKKPKPGGHSLMAPPGPIPNPEVKHQHVDGSRTTGPARVDSRQGSNEAPEPRGSGASSVFGEEYLYTV